MDFLKNIINPLPMWLKSHKESINIYNHFTHSDEHLLFDSFRYEREIKEGERKCYICDGCLPLNHYYKKLRGCEPCLLRMRCATFQWKICSHQNRFKDCKICKLCPHKFLETKCELCKFLVKIKGAKYRGEQLRTLTKASHRF